MIEEVFTDDERLLLVTLVTQAHVNIRDDPEMKHANDECNGILRKLTGTDTVLVAKRAYPSRR